MQNVDLVVLSRDDGPLDGSVQGGIDRQQNVAVRLHRVIGQPIPSDGSRWETIARARNYGKALGNSCWLMFLDDDVVLHPDCLQQLVNALLRRPLYAALAADYLREYEPEHVPPHVGMGATMFRRTAIDPFAFRWEADRCECQCLCDDLRRHGYAIGYLPQASAEHLRSNGWHRPRPSTTNAPCESTADRSADTKGHVLAAFDRSHFDRFCHQFLASLRRAGNRDPVTAVGYGLYPSQERNLRRLPQVTVRSLNWPKDSVPKSRLRDFQQAIAGLPPQTPVAYWDAGDVLFQGSLQPLWQTIQRHPNDLAVVREPFAHPENRVIAQWTLSIHDPHARQRAFDLLSRRPHFNAGFAAATAAVLRGYFQQADRLMHSSAMRGSTDWGDQIAMNLYCHTRDGGWREVAEAWNYCLCGRDPDSFSVGGDGRLTDHRGAPVVAIHGNAGTIPRVYRLHHYRQNPLLRSAQAIKPKWAGG